jgi:catechol-2,3-dioxygenase
VLGLTETGTAKDGRIVFFSAGVHHHDLSCELARADGPGPQPKGVPGLYHIAFDVGNSEDDLARARRHVESHGLTHHIAFDVGNSEDDLARARRHVESHGLTPFGEYAGGFCVRDPDGHEVELYVTGAGPDVARS